MSYRITFFLCLLQFYEETAVAQESVSSTGDVEGSRELAWHLGLEALSDLPVHVGGQLTAEMPFRIRMSTSLGALPKPYVDLLNAVVVAAGGYDEVTAEIVSAALHNSLVWRIHVGWRPLRDYGFYFEVGYGLVALGGELSSDEALSIATGRTSPDADTSRSYDVGSTLHMIDVEIGWEFVFWDHFIVRPAIGGAFTVGASTKIEPTFNPRSPRLIEEYTTYGETYLDDIYTSYVFTPTVSLSLGYRFF